MVLRPFWHQNWLLASIFSRIHIFSEPTWQFQNSNGKKSVFDFSKPLFDLTSRNNTYTCVICFLKRDQQRKRCGIRHLLSTFWCSLAIEKVNGFYPLWRPLCFHSTECISSHNVESISIQPSRCISSHNINVIFIILSKCISFHLIRPNLSISSYAVIKPARWER